MVRDASPAGAGATLVDLGDARSIPPGRLPVGSVLLFDECE
ncbi:hypothetical protein ACIRBX_02990 [Kitasatospora sp. NPDC096147]